MNDEGKHNQTMSENTELLELQEIPDDILIEELAERFEKDPKKGVQRITATSTHTHSGPLPDPDTLIRYEQAQPGLLERVVHMAEKEQEHRHTMENLLVSSKVETDRKGHNLGALLVIFILLICVFVIMNGFPKEGAAIAVTTITGIAAIFVGKQINGKKKETHED
jgi:uncharacterized membrane protein